MAVAQEVEGLDVAGCEVENVDVVANGCAIMGSIV
jgi:hypothetical protein